jgi:hypothetical protein
MQKKSFTAPFWYLIILGIASAGVSGYAIHQLSLAMPDYPIPPLFKVVRFSWSVIVFGEAVIYWKIRKMNPYRKTSWVHVLLFTAAFLTPLYRPFLKSVMDSHYSLAATAEMMKAVKQAEMDVFYILLLLAHGFFASLLIKCYNGRRFGPTISDSGDILDNELLDGE